MSMWHPETQPRGAFLTEWIYEMGGKTLSTLRRLGGAGQMGTHTYPDDIDGPDRTSKRLFDRAARI